MNECLECLNEWHPLWPMIIPPPATSPPTLPYLPTLFIHDPTLSSLGASLNKIFHLRFAAFAALRSPSFASLRIGSLAWRSWAQTRRDSRLGALFDFIFYFSCHVTLVWCLDMSLIHHLCKRETKRNVEAIVWFLVGCVFCATYRGTVQYSIHDMVFYTGRDPQIPEIPKKAEYLKWV